MAGRGGKGGGRPQQCSGDGGEKLLQQYRAGIGASVGFGFGVSVGVGVGVGFGVGVSE